MTNPSTNPDTRLSDERLAEMLAGLDGVTPGPWKRVEAYAGLTLVETPNGTLCKVPWDRPDMGNAHREAAHIARCDPDTIRAILTELQALRAPAGTDHFPGAGNIVAEPVFISRAFDPMTSHWFENQPLPNPPPSDRKVSDDEVEQAAKSICRLVPIDGSSAWIDPHGHVFPDEYSPREQATIRAIARAALQASKRGQP